MVDFHKELRGSDKLGKSGKVKNGQALSLAGDDVPEKLSLPVSNMDKAGAVYGELLDFVTENLDLAAKGRENELDGAKIKEKADAFSSVILTKIVPDDLVRLVFIHDDCRDNYIYEHSVNVCLLSVYLAIRLNFSKAKLVDLVIASLFHDIGLMRIPGSVWNQNGRLSQADYTEIKRHPIYGREIFEKIKETGDTVPLVIGQYHETVDGTGYPDHLKKDSINYLARLLSPVDRYEAQTHTRMWKPKVLPDKAMQQMLDHDQGRYDPHFMKAILKYISIFPVGSRVKISSEEYAEVVKVNEKTPMRPVIEVDLDRDKKPLPEKRIMDLSGQFLIHVQHCVDPGEMEPAGQ
jgi:HD-GYP domain-containing protein (c-di-GMP phosphodiesterase class II)